MPPTVQVYFSLNFSSSMGCKNHNNDNNNNQPNNYQNILFMIFYSSLERFNDVLCICVLMSCLKSIPIIMLIKVN